MKNWKKPLAAVLAGMLCIISMPQVQPVLPAFSAASHAVTYDNSKTHSFRSSVPCPVSPHWSNFHKIETHLLQFPSLVFQQFFPVLPLFPPFPHIS